MTRRKQGMVRPIDLQDNLSKTQAAERMNQIQKAHGEVGQKTVADAIKERARADMERAHAGEKTDMVIIRREQEKEKKKKDHEQQHVASDDQKQPPPGEDHLDVTA